MQRRIHAPRRLLALITTATLLAALPLVSPAGAKEKSAKVPTIRWAEGNAGCTFTRGDDGKYRYALWTDDLGLTLAVDSQELEKSRRRHQRLFGVILTTRFRGSGTLYVNPEKVTLEFVDHFHVVKNAIDPDYFSKQMQRQADILTDETEHQIEKHPDKKQEKEVFLQDYLKEVAQLQEFLHANSLRPATLDASNPEASGWIFFSTTNKWVGGWKKQENFVLRFPFKNRIFEFPFTLPPEEGDLILRRRETQ